VEIGEIYMIELMRLGDRIAGVLQCVAVCCSVLQCVEVGICQIYMMELMRLGDRVAGVLQRVAVGACDLQMIKFMRIR